MLRDCGAVALLSQTAYLRDMNTLQWECPDLRHIVCLDAIDFQALREEPGELMSRELWDFVASDGVDDIQAGGWKSPYTGQWLSREIMEGYGANARLKLAPLLEPGSRVLEIGVASGITMRNVAPLCGSYLGLDMTESVLAKAGREAAQRGLANVSLRRLRADQIGELPAGSFDCIVMNSVMECFPGLNYLRQVLDLCLERLTPQGHLFLGNVWDLDRRDILVASLEAFARENAGQGYNTKTDMSGELFVAKAFFRDWAAAAGRRKSLSLKFSDMQADERELSAYGYDLLISKGGPGSGVPGPEKGAWALSDFAGLPNTAPPIALEANNAAYAIFTSGTTGRPKGALMEHRNLVNLVDDLSERVLAPLIAPDATAKPGPLNLALIASFSFDASLQNIFASLLNGHTLHLASDQARRDPALLHAFLEQRAIHVADGTPSLFSMLLDHWESTGTFSRVRTFLLGGEALRPQQLARYYAMEAHSRCRVINAYGPTECCVDTTLHQLNSANWSKHPFIPIGTPVKGSEIFIVDSKGRILPAGVPGELLIAGDCVGRGYVNSPDLTAQRFVPHPLDPNRRAYRSGDLGRWRKDGVLEFLQREDAQVKVRGYRIECSEIETILRAYPGVREAVVKAGDFLGDGVPSLAAYLVADESATVKGMREHLLRKLPEYMAPSYFVRLEQLPLTVSGKVDRPALPSPVSSMPGAQAVRPPRTPTELGLAQIWSSLLQLAEVDAEADFFAQGGHSILAVRLLSLVERSFGVRLRLDRLFARATLRGVAASIDEALAGRGPQAWTPLVTAKAEGQLPPLFCFHPVGGNILCYQHLASLLGPDQPVHMIQSYGLEEGQEALSRVEDLTALYLATMLERFPQGPYALAGWSFGGLVAWEAARQLASRGQQVSALVLLDSVALPDKIVELLNRDEADFLASLFAEVLPLDPEHLRGMDTEQRQDHIMALGRERGVFPPDIGRPLMRRLLALFKANGLAAVRYRPPALDLSTLLVLPEKTSGLNLPDDPLQGWGERALGGVRLCTVPGSHGTMLMPPQVEEVAAAMIPYLREAAGKTWERPGHGR
jgi:amino acid adenylation domain-containing protein